MIKVSSVTKKFGDLTAVNDISFEVKAGEVLGFLGPNGAGKSTTMKVITGFLRSSEGEVHVCGHSINTETQLAQKDIGYMPENAPLYEDMYVREFLEFISGMRKIPSKEVNSSIERVIKICALDGVEYQKIDTLSKGYKRRVSLAQALIHDPKVLILDEPTDGLDPNQKYDVRTLIKKLAKEKCVLVSTHILEEVEEICDRCIIIGQGRMLFEGKPEKLKSMSDRGRIQDVFRSLTTGQVMEGVSI